MKRVWGTCLIEVLCPSASQDPEGPKGHSGGGVPLHLWRSATLEGAEILGSLALALAGMGHPREYEVKVQVRSLGGTPLPERWWRAMSTRN